METTVSALLAKGGSLDGPIKYPIHGKVACVRRSVPLHVFLSPFHKICLPPIICFSSPSHQQSNNFFLCSPDGSSIALYEPDPMVTVDQALKLSGALR